MQVLTLNGTPVLNVTLAQSFSIEVGVRLSGADRPGPGSVHREVGAGVVEDLLVPEGEQAGLDPGGEGNIWKAGYELGLVCGLGLTDFVLLQRENRRSILSSEL